MYDNLVSALLNCGVRDLNLLDELLGVAEKFEINIDDVIEKTRELFNKVEFNELVYILMEHIFNAVMDEVEQYAGETEDKKLLKQVKDLRDNFSPFLNYIDSWFNNLLDEVDLEQSRDEIIRDVIEKLRED